VKVGCWISLPLATSDPLIWLDQGANRFWRWRIAEDATVEQDWERRVWHITCCSKVNLLWLGLHIDYLHKSVDHELLADDIADVRK
jgi:hypothetical protein